MRIAIAAALAAILGACAMPNTVSQTRDVRPALAISGAPQGSTLSVDGLAVGPAGAYDGHPAVLRLEPGTHEVVVRDGNGNVLLQQKVFLESELKTVVVH